MNRSATAAGPDIRLPERRSGFALGLTRVLTGDYCAWANRYVYWLKTPLGCLAVFAVLAFLCGATTAPQGYLIGFVLLALIGWGMLWPLVALWGLRPSLEFEQRRAIEGETVRARLSLANRWPWPVWGLTLAEGFASHRPLVSLAAVPGWAQATFDFDFVPNLRGDYPEAPPRLQTSFPFGVWTARKRVAVGSRLLVWPRWWTCETPLLATGERFGGGWESSARAGDWGDRIGVRPYRPGDGLRFVHWRHTARLDQLMVCERQGRAYSPVFVRLDRRPNGAGVRSPDSSAEWAIRVTATVCIALLEAGLPLEVDLGPAQFHVRPTSRDRQRLLDSLASLDGREGSLVSPSSSGLDILISNDARAVDGSRPTLFILLGGEEFDDGSPDLSSPHRSHNRAPRTIRLVSPHELPARFRAAWGTEIVSARTERRST